MIADIREIPFEFAALRFCDGREPLVGSFPQGGACGDRTLPAGDTHTRKSQQNERRLQLGAVGGHQVKPGSPSRPSPARRLIGIRGPETYTSASCDRGRGIPTAWLGYRAHEPDPQ